MLKEVRNESEVGPIVKCREPSARGRVREIPTGEAPPNVQRPSGGGSGKGQTWFPLSRPQHQVGVLSRGEASPAARRTQPGLGLARTGGVSGKGRGWEQPRGFFLEGEQWLQGGWGRTCPTSCPIHAVSPARI